MPMASGARRSPGFQPRKTIGSSGASQAGKAIFESEAAGCATCDPSSSEFTNRSTNELKKLPLLPGFEDEDDAKFRTPSLLFVAGTAPYFHDGSAATLDALVAQNQDRMGRTTRLNDEQRAALVAYLETL